MVRKHKVINSNLVMEVVMRGVMDNLERGGVRHQLGMGLQMSNLMVNVSVVSRNFMNWNFSMMNWYNCSVVGVLDIMMKWN